MRLSVIVPIYNAERGLRRCLDSLLDQGLGEGEMEVLCVDDASTDGSREIIGEYRKHYGGIIRLIENHENMGCPASRNRGIEAARGEIVTFCDADDYLVPGAYRLLLNKRWREGLDVLRFTSHTMDSHSKRHWSEPAEIDLRIDYEGDGIGFYSKMMPYFVWQLMIRRDFLMKCNIRFRDYVLCDDSAFCLDLMMANPQLVSVRANIYRYVVEQNSLTTKREPQKMRRIVESYLQMMQTMKEYGKVYARLHNTMDTYIQQQMIPCLSRAFSARYSRVEWHDVVSMMRKLGGLPLTQAGKTGRIMGWMVADYLRYQWGGWLYREVFVKHILPRMKHNA